MHRKDFEVILHPCINAGHFEQTDTGQEMWFGKAPRGRKALFTVCQRLRFYIEFKGGQKMEKWISLSVADRYLATI